MNLSFDEEPRARVKGGLFFLASALIAVSPMGYVRPALGQLVPSDSSTNLSQEIELDAADSTVLTHLERYRALLADGQWDEAVETLLQIMENQADRMISQADPQSGGYRLFIPVRNDCQRRLCTLPPEHREVLRLYRRRVDPLAKRWFDEAIAGRDVARLEQIVDQFFASSVGDNALDALGEISLQQGDYTSARYHWERIHPTLRLPAADSILAASPDRPIWLTTRGLDWEKHADQIRSLIVRASTHRSWLAYPDSEIDRARVHARLVLASILEGSPERAKCELELLRRLHPRATGLLGGREVIYEESLGSLLEMSQQPTNDATRQRTNSDWTSFAGGPSRCGVATETVDLALSPAWTAELEGNDHGALGTGASPTDGRRSTRHVWVAESPGDLRPFHPVVAGDRVLVNGPRRIRTIDIRTGQAEEIYPRSAGELPALSDPTPQLGIPRFTMTVFRDHVFARTGPSATTFLEGPGGHRDRASITGIDLRTGKLLFDPIVPDDPRWSFDGTPVADESCIYVAMRQSGIRPRAHVACFDASSGRQLWRSEVCSADTLANGAVEEVTHNLLTLDGNFLYFNTNMGVIASLSKRDGAVRWITSYPRTGTYSADRQFRPWHLRRDVNPCVFHKGMLFVAPSDCDQVLALEASTGLLVWKTNFTEGVLDAVHLLGVVGDRLIASGRRLWWLDAYTGQLCRDVAENPFPRSGQPDPGGFGRGVLAGNIIYWPCRSDEDEIYVFSQSTGRQVRQPIPLSLVGAEAGNLFVAKGHLLITTSDRMYAFNSSGRVEPDDAAR
jgi:outer membrane protein assembly factor BamB